MKTINLKSYDMSGNLHINHVQIEAAQVAKSQDEVAAVAAGMSRFKDFDAIALAA